MAPRSYEGAAAAVLLLVLCLGAADAAASQATACNGPRLGDRIIGHSQLYGQPNASDAIWADQTAYFEQYGPLTNVMMLRAYFYDGEWHDPGEFKGLQTWYGNNSYNASNPDQFLFGARKPHLQFNCSIGPGEAIVRAEVQHDRLHRFMSFTLNTGRVCAWGFPNATNTTTFVANAPNPGAYIAAIRGFEGKPLPPERGGYKKRYIVQVSWVWAQSDCADLRAFTPLTPGNAARRASTTESWSQRLNRTSAVLMGRQGPLTGAPAKPSAKPTPAATNSRPVAAKPRATPQAVTSTTPRAVVSGKPAAARGPAAVAAKPAVKPAPAPAQRGGPVVPAKRPAGVVPKAGAVVAPKAGPVVPAKRPAGVVPSKVGAVIAPRPKPAAASAPAKPAPGRPVVKPTAVRPAPAKLVAPRPATAKPAVKPEASTVKPAAAKPAPRKLLFSLWGQRG